MRKFAIFLSLLLLLSFSSGASADPTLVNINKADAAALQQSLVGIGPTRAEAIVKYRKKNGKFRSTSDLKNVPGIGEKLVKKNGRYLSTSKGAVRGDAKKYQASKKAASKTRTTRRTTTTRRTSTSRTGRKTTGTTQGKKKVVKKKKVVRKTGTNSTGTRRVVKKKKVVKKKTR